MGPSKHKTVDHPAVGRITLDCDTLVVAADDLRITLYTAEPGTEHADRLALSVVLGARALIGLGPARHSVTGHRSCNR
ncbi:hypothetical protein ACFFX1_52800 [Dactylosporangium sucinum]|uniref:MmyB-like transcription regulator ligand binding domain-containing protein n=1 Tax=Dactylosporangium sucinum TaxID=1424081 RepID=A0A917UE03_9ACTN|nr:hypothetical protein [Dactylosporangium sucinum]GGM76325.1 hypothetical protein GCM10007977_092260 [Dactylosporangium sucinum]